MFEEQTNQDDAPAGEEGAGQSEVSNEAHQDDESLLNLESGEQSDTPGEENDEIEVDGKKFALPKSAAEKLKAERLMHSDYTRKTQEVAEQRREVEAHAAEVQRLRQESQQYIAEVARVVAIDEQINELNQLDWPMIIDQAPQEALKLQQKLRLLEGKRNEAVNALEQKRHHNALSEQQAIAKQVQDAEAYFAREIAGWSPARSDQLLKYGVAEGMDAKALAQVVIRLPQVAKLMHKAELYDQIVKKQTPPPAAPAPAQAKPAAKVGQNASVKKDPTKMTDAEYAEYRRRVQSNRRK